MKTNPVRAKLKRSEPAIGTWLTLPSTIAAFEFGTDRIGFHGMGGAD